MRNNKASSAPVFFSLVYLIFFTLSVSAEDSTLNCAEAGKKFKEGVALSDASAAEEKLYREAVAACPNMPEAYHNLGVVLNKQGRVDDAIAQIEKAIALKNDPTFRVTVGLIYLAQNRLADAKSTFDKALEVDSGNSKALQGVSVVYERQKDLSKAAEVLERALAQEPENGTIQFNLAVLQDKLGSEKAVGSYKKAIELDPANFEARLYLGLLYERSNKLEEAEQSLLKAASLKPGRVEIERALGTVYEKQGDNDKAELALRKAITLDSSDVVSHVNLGIVLIRKRQEALAEEVLKKAATLSPKNAKALSVLGWAQLELGKYHEAESSLKLSVDLDPRDASSHNNLGVLYKRMGKNDEAAKEFERAAKLKE